MCRPLNTIRFFIESSTSIRRTKRRHDNPGPVFHLRQGARCVRRRSLCSYFAFFLRGLFFFTTSSSFVRGGGDSRSNARSREREPQKLRCDVSIDRFAKLFSSLFCDDGKEEAESIDRRRRSHTTLVVAVSSSPWRGLFSSGLTRSLSLSLSPLIKR